MPCKCRHDKTLNKGDIKFHFKKETKYNNIQKETLEVFASYM